jgi:hypothetical protein
VNKSETARVIGIIRARYPRSEWGPNEELTVEAWHMSLGDLPLEPVVAALKAMFLESQFAPDPVDIRGRVASEAGVAPEPAEAWRIAQGAIATYYPGHKNAIDIPDVVRQALNAIGGIHNLKMSDDPSGDRDAFLKAYATYRKRALSDTGGFLEALGEGNVRMIGGE